MSIKSLVRDKQIAAKEEKDLLAKKKNCTPPDNYGDRYVTGLEKQYTNGKGSRCRDLAGWHSNEVTERLRKIYGKKKTN